MAADKEMDQTFTKALLRITATSEVNPVPLPVDVGADSVNAHICERIKEPEAQTEEREVIDFTCVGKIRPG